MGVRALFNGETFRIIECTNPGEYLALSDNQKDSYRIIVSAVVVDMSEGSRARTSLLAMFPEGTTTGDAIRDPENGLTPAEVIPNP
jgi:hypothetical protein